MFYRLERGYGNDNLCYANMCLWHFLSSFLYNDKFYGTESKQSHLSDVIELSINYMQQNLSTMLLLGDIALHVKSFGTSFLCLIPKEDRVFNYRIFYTSESAESLSIPAFYRFTASKKFQKNWELKIPIIFPACFRS